MTITAETTNNAIRVDLMDRPSTLNAALSRFGAWN
jgi:hypothetical protein